MVTFSIVVLVIIVSLIVLGAFIWAGLVWQIGADASWRIRTRVLHSLGSLLVIAVTVTLVINSVAFSSNNAEHCGPGTRYVSESHYSVATKTTVTEWMCVV